jgi:hypothetical protein
MTRRLPDDLATSMHMPTSWEGEAQSLPRATKARRHRRSKRVDATQGRPHSVASSRVMTVFRQLDPSVQLKWHADDGDHIAAAGSLTAAIEAARRAAGSRKVDVEVETPQEFAEALRASQCAWHSTSHPGRGRGPEGRGAVP